MSMNTGNASARVAEADFAGEGVLRHATILASPETRGTT